MLISTDLYRSLHVNETLEELFEEEKRLASEIVKLKRIVEAKDESNELWQSEPGPKVLLARYREYYDIIKEIQKIKKVHSAILIRKIDITTLGTDAIVNAANSALQAGSGVCGAIFIKAGFNELQDACDVLGPCKTGEAVITPGFRLDAKYIIHAVGPMYRGGNHDEGKLLYNAYKNSLLLAKSKNLHSIAFPLISAGVYGYPIEDAWRKGIEACQDFINENKDYQMKIIFAVLDEKILNVGLEILNQYNN